ncbi:hypothetical protein QFC22_001875 [Naganishia vaughanmartiniae]|uniref:Uncharacterized protein n=1 Tax=Naganishia vaughanmartiniae TaxID=1424756 RepID=A0ACC2XFS0_9TREE|nr:hypothetical protein QFC22_001875 [Naganishia vaughanmartiniae]
MFLIRSVYRTIELSEGYTGYLNTHEPYFYLLDTLPLWLGISVYVWFWPPKYLTEDTRIIPSVSSGGDVEYTSDVPVIASAETSNSQLGSLTPSVKEKAGLVDVEKRST